MVIAVTGSSFVGYKYERTHNLAAFLLLVSICLCTQVNAAQLNIPRLETVPSIDDFLHDQPVTRMARVSGFIQNLPHDGEPASQDTVAYIGYDSQNL